MTSKEFFLARNSSNKEFAIVSTDCLRIYITLTKEFQEINFHFENSRNHIPEDPAFSTGGCTLVLSLISIE